MNVNSNWLWGALALIGAFTVTFVLYGRTSLPPDAADFTNIYSFGRVKAGTDINHTFRLKNTFDVPLSVTSVQTSCGCTVASAPKGKVPPGRFVELPVQVKTVEKSGVVAETIYVRFENDTVRSFTIAGFVDGQRLAVLDFGMVKRGDKSVQTFQVQWPTKDFGVLGMHYAPRLF